MQEQLVITGDPETGEMYLARLIDDRDRGHGPQTNPLVEILQIVRYPSQHAIAHPEIPTEIPPISSGAVLRMAILRNAASADLVHPDYENSRLAAIDEAIESTKNAAEQAILLRHRSGEIRRKRILRTYSKYELGERS